MGRLDWHSNNTSHVLVSTTSRLASSAKNPAAKYIRYVSYMDGWVGHWVKGKQQHCGYGLEFSLKWMDVNKIPPFLHR